VRGLDATRRIDTYAAGIVLWEALTGRPLFRKKDDVGTINAVLSMEAPAPSSLMPAVTPELDAIVLKALQRDPADRYQTAAEFVDALEQLPIQRATTRGVAAYVESVLGPALEQRRGLIREASEQGLQTFGNEPIESSVHSKLAQASEDRRTERPGAVFSAGLAGAAPLAAPAPASEVPAAGEAAAKVPVAIDAIAPDAVEAMAPGALEHRRMRGLLAAAMLLLVGGALGLLLARSNSSSKPAPAPSSVEKPASESHSR
jgi:eukaryotic-like serine/threonine-protein kinase